MADAVVRSARGKDSDEELGGIEEVASEDEEPIEEDFGTGIDIGANPGQAIALLFALGSVRSPRGRSTLALWKCLVPDPPLVL